MNTNDKLREALEAVLKCIWYKKSCTVLMDGSAYIENYEKQIREALALPRRNCDVGTPEEQAKRFKSYCKSKVCKRGVCHCYGYEELFHYKCFPIWAQMPYEEVK